MWSDSMSFSIARHLILPVGFEQEAHTLLSFWQQLEHAMWPFEHCKCHTRRILNPNVDNTPIGGISWES
jgi:hypothetical protein